MRAKHAPSGRPRSTSTPDGTSGAPAVHHTVSPPPALPHCCGTGVGSPPGAAPSRAVSSAGPANPPRCRAGGRRSAGTAARRGPRSASRARAWPPARRCRPAAGSARSAPPSRRLASDHRAWRGCRRWPAAASRPRGGRSWPAGHARRSPHARAASRRSPRRTVRLAGWNATGPPPWNESRLDIVATFRHDLARGRNPSGRRTMRSMSRMAQPDLDHARGCAPLVVAGAR